MGKTAAWTDFLGQATWEACHVGQVPTLNHTGSMAIAVGCPRARPRGEQGHLNMPPNKTAMEVQSLEVVFTVDKWAAEPFERARAEVFALRPVGANVVQV